MSLDILLYINLGYSYFVVVLVPLALFVALLGSFWLLWPQACVVFSILHVYSYHRLAFVFGDFGLATSHRFVHFWELHHDLGVGVISFLLFFSES